MLSKGMSNNYWTVDATESIRKPYLLCEPSLTISSKRRSLTFDATSDMNVNAMVWSVNSSDTHVENEILEDEVLKQSSVTTIDSGNNERGERIGNVGMNVNENDEMFLK